MKIIGRIDTRAVRLLFLKLGRNSRKLDPAMNSIKNMVQSSVEQNFQDEGRPTPWQMIELATQKARRRINKWPGPILQVSGELASSINTRVERNLVIVGSNKPYAAPLNAGSLKNNLPARPFLLFQDEDVKEAKEILNEHLLRGIK